MSIDYAKYQAWNEYLKEKALYNFVPPAYPPSLIKELQKIRDKRISKLEEKYPDFPEHYEDWKMEMEREY